MADGVLDWGRLWEVVSTRAEGEALDREISEHYGNVLGALSELNRIIGRVENGLAMLAAAPPWHQAPACVEAIAVLEIAKHRHGALLDSLKDYLRQSGRPGMLRAKGSLWRTLAQAPVSGRAAYFDVGFMNVDDWWRDGAAEIYKGKLGPQKAAIGATADKAGEMAGHLHNLATAITTFWGDVAQEVVAYIDRMSKNLGNVANPLGHVQILVDVVSGIENTAVGLWTHVEVAATKFQTNTDEINRLVKDSKTLPGGGWPSVGDAGFASKSWNPHDN